MSLNATPSANRVHIGFFGRRNAGKSSLVNAVTGQDLAVVSEIKGTTTDPVPKAMELLPLGPVVIIDTPGFDDDGLLGEKRVARARRVLEKTDVAVLVVDAAAGLDGTDRELIRLFKDRNVNYIVAYNKSDLLAEPPAAGTNEIYVSALIGAGVWELKERIARLAASEDLTLKIVGDLLKPLDTVVLVIPIDTAAPKGRLILPQQQTVRDVLEAGAAAVVVRDTELKEVLAGVRPRLVITDSQAFAKVSAETPPDVDLTSFSILFARFKGFLEPAVRGAKALDGLKDGSRILIAEGCTHHRQCDDIGTVKMPRWIREYSGRSLEFSFVSGGEFPEDLSPYDLAVHCGACMNNEREMKYRLRRALEQDKPFTNYGIAIAFMRGILKRCLGVFPSIAATLD